MWHLELAAECIMMGILLLIMNWGGIIIPSTIYIYVNVCVCVPVIWLSGWLIEGAVWLCVSNGGCLYYHADWQLLTVLVCHLDSLQNDKKVASWMSVCLSVCLAGWVGGCVCGCVVSVCLLAGWLAGLLAGLLAASCLAGLLACWLSGWLSVRACVSNSHKTPFLSRGIGFMNCVIFGGSVFSRPPPSSLNNSL